MTLTEHERRTDVGSSSSVVLPASALARAALLVLLFALAASSVVSLAGGPDAVPDVRFSLFGAVLLLWFGSELRRPQSRGFRMLLWFGIAAAALMVMFWIVELFAA